MSRRKAALYLFAAMMLTGANLSLGKVIVQEVPVFLFIVYRFLVCSLVLAAIVRNEGGPRLLSMSRAQVLDVVFMALFGMLGFTVLSLEGLRRTSAVDAGVITATIPAVVVALAFLFLRERPNGRQLAAVLMSVVGIAIIQVASARSGSSSFLGNFLIAGAVVGEASFVIFSKRLAPPFRPIRLALAVNIAGFVLAVPLALTTLNDLDFSAITPSIWLMGTWYVLAAGVFTLLLWYRGLPHVETYMAGMAMSAIPITALAISILFLGEQVSASQFMGAGLVIAAIFLAARATRL